MKKKLLIGVVVIAVLGMGIASGWVFRGGGDEDNTVVLTMPQVVANDLVIRYGQNIQIVQGPTEAKEVWLSYMQDATRLVAVMWIDGLMVELASAPLKAETGNTTQ